MKPAKQISISDDIIEEMRANNRDALYLSKQYELQSGDRVHLISDNDVLEVRVKNVWTSGTLDRVIFGPQLTAKELLDPRTDPDALGSPEAPEGFEWVLLPERPQKAPGEKGQYSELNPEPIQVFEAWGLDGLEFAMLKYGARYKRKGGIEDLEKVKFYANRLIARERREGRE